MWMVHTRPKYPSFRTLSTGRQYGPLAWTGRPRRAHGAAIPPEGGGSPHSRWFAVISPYRCPTFIHSLLVMDYPQCHKGTCMSVLGIYGGFMRALRSGITPGTPFRERCDLRHRRVAISGLGGSQRHSEAVIVSRRFSSLLCGRFACQKGGLANSLDPCTMASDARRRVRVCGGVGTGGAAAPVRFVPGRCGSLPHMSGLAKPQIGGTLGELAKGQGDEVRSVAGAGAYTTQAAILFRPLAWHGESRWAVYSRPRGITAIGEGSVRRYHGWCAFSRSAPVARLAPSDRNADRQESIVAAAAGSLLGTRTAESGVN
jgi:hypothetical protein